MMGDTSCTSMIMTNCIIIICLQILLLNDVALCKSIDKHILDAAPKADMFDIFHLMPEGEVMIMTELDLLLTMDQYKYLYTSQGLSSRKKRKAIRVTQRRWSHCTVFYEITPSLNSPQNIKIIKEAIAEWEKFSCLVFQKSTSEKRRIQFQNGEGCYSQVGMQNKPQPIVLAPDCRTKGIIVHEIGHAIGWYHEHMRPDRDDFVTINYNVIAERFWPNFKKYNTSVVDNYDVPYDYTSVMHYGNDGLPGSIVTLDPSYQNKIGQREGFTFKDIKLANLMYKCSEVAKCAPKTCKFGGFVFSKIYKGVEACSCWCDSGKPDDPLILCSLIDKELPPPNVREIILDTTKLCYDVRDDCANIIQDDSGICLNKMDLMMTFCARSCDFCNKGELMCMDYEKGCPVIAASKACTNEAMRPLLETVCPASCGVCKKSNPCEVMHEMMRSWSGIVDGSKVLRILIVTYVIAYHLI